MTARPSVHDEHMHFLRPRGCHIHDCSGQYRQVQNVTVVSIHCQLGASTQTLESYHPLLQPFTPLWRDLGGHWADIYYSSLSYGCMWARVCNFICTTFVLGHDDWPKEKMSGQSR